MDDKETQASLWGRPEEQAWWDSLSRKERILWITGQLWNCTDVMPRDLCKELGLPQGSTYAQGARYLREA